MKTPSPHSPTLVPHVPIAPPAFPLSPERHDAYQALFDLYQTIMDGTIDSVVLTAINPSYLDVGDLLTKDKMYKLHQTTALFQALKEQFDATNDGLNKLADEIAATASHFAQAAAILDAIRTAFPYVATAL